MKSKNISIITAISLMTGYCGLLIVFLHLVIQMPAGLRDIKDNQSVQITDRNGVPLREVLSANEGRSRWVNLDDISMHLINATIAAEDKRFYYHFGVDPIAIVRAALTNIKHGKIISGGSTITQQLVRIINPRSRTILSKLNEAVFAIKLEMLLRKKHILEQYLNRAPYGNQLFGIESASQMYFGKPARDLSISESAFLAILPRAPSAYDPYRDPQRIEKLHKDLIRKLRVNEKITEDEEETALNAELALIPKRWAFKAPHFVEMLPAATHGGSVRTSLDIKIQEEVENIVSANLRALDKYNVTNAAVIVIDNPTGEILALVGSHNYSNIEISGQVNGAKALRQPGSTLKPFTYAMALDNKYTPASIIPDIELHFPTEKGDYIPRNYDRKFRGPVRLRSALANSLNVPAVYVLSRFGTSQLLERLHNMDFVSLSKEPSYYGLGLTLGNGEVTLMELAGGYSTLARGGKYIPLSFFPRKAISPGKAVFSKESAYLIADILSDNGSRRMSFGEDTPLNLPFRVAAKTGTSKNFRDNWTIGFTPEYTVAVWVGNFDASEMRGVSGISGAGPIFRDVFLELAKEKELTWFEPPQNLAEKGVCPLSGKLVTNHCMESIDEIFVAGTEPREFCPFHVEKEIDRRNGLLATESCGEQNLVVRSFVELPDRYYEWAKANDVNIPPRTLSPFCSTQKDSHENNAISSSRHIKITHPNDNSVYSIDPYIPRRLQTLFFKAEASDPIVWKIDGAEIGKTSGPHAIEWPIEEGEHTLSISSADKSMRDEIKIKIFK